MKDGGPAFPAIESKKGENAPSHVGQYYSVHHTGMSLRDWFAGMALQGLLSADYNTEASVKEAYEIADLMLVERE